MSDPTAPADPAAMAEQLAKETAAALLAEAEQKAAAAKVAHDMIVEQTTAQHTALLAKIEGLKGQLEASLAKLKDDVNHAGYATAFLERGHLLVDEFSAWIGRHV